MLKGREWELPKVLAAGRGRVFLYSDSEEGGERRHAVTLHVAIGGGAGARGVRDRVRATTGRAPRCGLGAWLWLATTFARAVRRESRARLHERALAFLSTSLSSHILILDADNVSFALSTCV